MTSIYTRGGDTGETGLLGGGRVFKDSPRVEAYGDVDELSAALGLARSLGLPSDVDAQVATAQDRLFTLGSVLATPHDSPHADKLPKLQPDWVSEMEAAIDAFDRELPALRNFILPGGEAGSSALHLARTICRRAERRVVGLAKLGEAAPASVVFLNRLSDLIFTWARVVNHRAGVAEPIWRP